ncbi:MAG: radical SAM protein [Planctomycetota bacterium]
MTSSPSVPLDNFDELWFQVGGTLCNLSCHHCFISCRPGNDTFRFLDLETVDKYLKESAELGVKEYYFTGGEPFLNRDLLPILERTLAIGPATVLTNATVLTDKTIDRLEQLNRDSRYSLELRVSIDGYDAEHNDPIRGEGTFDAAMDGVRRLVGAGFLPIITIAQTWPEEESLTVFEGFVKTLNKAGYDRPRLKILPTLHLGAEVERTRGYEKLERVTDELLVGFDTSALLCTRGRIVTDRGVAVCPILIESDDAHLGSTLADARKPFELKHGACYTCYQYGAICSNVGGSGVG